MYVCMHTHMHTHIHTHITHTQTHTHRSTSSANIKTCCLNIKTCCLNIKRARSRFWSSKKGCLYCSCVLRMRTTLTRRWQRYMASLFFSLARPRFFFLLFLDIGEREFGAVANCCWRVSICVHILLYVGDGQLYIYIYIYYPHT